MAMLLRRTIQRLPTLSDFGVQLRITVDWLRSRTLVSLGQIDSTGASLADRVHRVCVHMLTKLDDDSELPRLGDFAASSQLAVIGSEFEKSCIDGGLDSLLADAQASLRELRGANS